MTFKRENIERENTFIFGDHDLSNLVIVEKIVRNFLPPALAYSTSISGRDGRHFQRMNFDSLSILLTLRFIEDTYEDVQKRALQVARLLGSKKPQKINLRDTPLYNVGIVTQSTDVEKTAHTGICEVIFTCYDVSYYGDEKIIDLGEETIFTNDLKETFGIITLTTESTEMIRLTLNDGKFLRFNNSFESGAELIIDLEKEFARLNGNLSMDKLTFDSDFFSIVSGENKIKIEGASGFLKYIERW